MNKFRNKNCGFLIHEKRDSYKLKIYSQRPLFRNFLQEFIALSAISIKYHSSRGTQRKYYLCPSSVVSRYRGRSIRSQIFSLGKWPASQSRRLRQSTKTSAGARSNVESYWYLSRRNPRSSRCLPVKWVNKSSGVIHLSRSAAAEGIVATRRIRDRERRKRTEEDAIAGFKFVRRVYQHALAGALGPAWTLFLSFVLVFFKGNGDARDKAARRIGRGISRIWEVDVNCERCRQKGRRERTHNSRHVESDKWIYGWWYHHIIMQLWCKSWYRIRVYLIKDRGCRYYLSFITHAEYNCILKREIFTRAENRRSMRARIPFTTANRQSALANIILSREFSSLRPFLVFWAKEITLSARCSLKMITRRM